MKLFLLAFVMGLCNWMHKMEIGYNTGYSIFESPVTSGVLAGLVLGKPIEGLMIGPYFVLAVLISFIASGNTTIYPSQKFPVDKSLFHFQKK